MANHPNDAAYNRALFAWIGWAELPSPAEIARLEQNFPQYTSKRSQKALRELQTIVTNGDLGPKVMAGFKKSLTDRLRATQIRLEFLRMIADGSSQKDARGDLAMQFRLSKTRIRALTKRSWSSMKQASVSVSQV